MTLNLTPTTLGVSAISPPRITVIGVGGGGGNAVDNMISTDLTRVEFIVANTDAQQLNNSKANVRLQLGPALTRGLGAGAKPDIGRQSAEEIEEELHKHLKGVDLVFITAGMGGGTGTGAAPVIARIAHENGALTIGVVSKPFQFEGIRRARAADAGIAELQKYVDTLIVIPNQNLFSCATQTTSLIEAFQMADEVLHRGVRSITDLMVIPGRINLDFSDVKTVMSAMGKAMIGTGLADHETDGADWAILAAERAISNPLLEETSIKGASGLLVNVTGGPDLGLHDYTQIMERIGEEAHPDAEIISGLLVRDDMTGKVGISVVATGLTPQRDPHNDNVNNLEQPHSETPPSTHTSTSSDTAPPPTGKTTDPAPENHAAQPNPTIPNYHLDPRPTQQTYQHSQGHITPQQALPTKNTDSGHNRGGVFSRFFRSRPTPEPRPATPRPNPYLRQEQRTSQQPQPYPAAQTPSNAQSDPQNRYREHDNQRPDPSLDIPAYLRRPQ